MAYVFGFSKDVTEIIYSMRDFRYEEVKERHGTPSRLCFVCTWPYEPMQTPCIWTYRIHSYDGVVPIVIRIRDQVAGTNWRLVLRNEDNVRPDAFRQREEQNDCKLKQLWFQCEPC
jgi:hypothetical protein